MPDRYHVGIRLQESNPCESAFIKLKGCLLSDVVLAHPNYTKDFHLFTDASNYGLGACLMQVDDEGHLKPLMYFSKSLNNAQKRYSTTKKEFLAIYEALSQASSQMNSLSLRNN